MCFDRFRSFKHCQKVGPSFVKKFGNGWEWWRPPSPPPPSIFEALTSRSHNSKSFDQLWWFKNIWNAFYHTRFKLCTKLRGRSMGAATPRICKLLIFLKSLHFEFWCMVKTLWPPHIYWGVFVGSEAHIPQNKDCLKFEDCVCVGVKPFGRPVGTNTWHCLACLTGTDQACTAFAMKYFQAFGKSSGKTWRGLATPKI